MTFDEITRAAAEKTTKTSDTHRALAMVGIAVSWLLMTDTSIAIANILGGNLLLLSAMTSFGLFLAFDLLQYFIGGLLWYFYLNITLDHWVNRLAPNQPEIQQRLRENMDVDISIMIHQPVNLLYFAKSISCLLGVMFIGIGVLDEFNGNRSIQETILGINDLFVVGGIALLLAYFAWKLVLYINQTMVSNDKSRISESKETFEMKGLLFCAKTSTVIPKESDR